MTNWLNKLYQHKVWLILAALVFAIQLLVPAYMIFEQQQTLKYGELYKFKIRPIDPYDPFRGRYVVLSFDASRNAILYREKDRKTKINSFDSPKRNDWIYAKLITDKEGYAQLSELSMEKPEAGNDYLRVQVRYGSAKNKYHIRIPFDRYYAPEGKAYAIETNVRQRSRRNSNDQVYVAVKIRNGKGTIENLYINQMPILEFVEKAIE